MAISTPHQNFDVSLYPRTYTASVGNLVVWVSLAALVGVGGLWGVWYFGTGHETQGPRDVMLMVFISFLFVALGGYLAASMLMSKVILRADTIEVQNVGSRQVMPRDEIAGRRLLPTKYISTLELVPKQKERKKLKIGMIMRTDAAFDAWLASIPDLDVAELVESETQIAGDLEFGFTPEQRSERLTKAKTTAKWLTRVASTVTVWGWFYARPYVLIMAILAALPLIVVIVLMRSGGFYQIEGRRNDARPSLAIPFLFPGLILMLRALMDVEFLRWMPLLTLCLAGGVALTLLVVSADRQMRTRRWGMLTVFLFAAAYSLGVAAQADSLLDRSVPQTFEVAILSKRISSGRSTTYYLRIPPWGPQTSANEVSVPRSFYNSVVLQQSVCVNLFSGALKIPWYFVAGCR